jgi:hypothetical protein
MYDAAMSNDPASEVEAAIRAFETITGLTVCFHDQAQGWLHLLGACRR